MPWTFYPAFGGTLISVVAWTYFARQKHVAGLPRTLSELASEDPHGLLYYRIVLWVCGPLFGVTTQFFIVPRIAHAFWVGTACALFVLAELAVGVFPARRGHITAHDIIAAVMGFGMTLSGFLFAWSLAGGYRNIEIGFSLAMSVLAILTMADRKHYIFYELPFLYITHFSVLAAALALR